MDIPVYSIAGQIIGQVSVDETALGGEPSMETLRQALIMHEANQRVGTVQVKRRGTVRGSGVKPWPQKHTGRARHGTRYSNIWVGGAVAHGPRPRDHRQKMNRSARRRALWSAFLLKARDGEVIAVDGLELPQPKTREMAVILRNLGVQRTFVIVLRHSDPELWRCARNIPGAAMATYSDLNAYQMIRPRRVIFTKEALEQFLADAAAQSARPDPAGAAEDRVEVSGNG